MNFGPQIVRSGLVLYLDAANKKSYKGSGNSWLNLANTSYNSTLYNFGATTFNSSNGGSIVFDGSDDYASSGALVGSFASFSVIVWFYPTSVSNYENPIDCNYGYNGTTGNIGPRLEMNDAGNLTWVYSNITNNNDAFYTQAVVQSGLTANTWHCAGITYNGSSNTSTTFYNGNSTGLSRGSYGSPTGFIAVMNNITIGKGFSLGGVERAFTGRVAQTLIYDRTLSASEVLQNFNAVKTRFGL
jgi:hypothetical protein